MTKANYVQMHDLREIVHSHAEPLANRMTAQARYVKLMDEAVTDFDKHLEEIRAQVNELVKPS